ncbi:MAG: hypothetical protein Q8Q31_01640 [Nanoarchaeota archaeon]|nr:hypothetical protein [Nanoarchaeota archaeon]
MNKRALSLIKNSIIACIFLAILFFMFFGFAGHVVTTSAGTSSFNGINEDTSFTYNISINNSDTAADANISEVNLSIPSSFTFTLNTNATNADYETTFTNTSTVLSWKNSSKIINETDTKYFWFNATASSPGSYNFTVTTLNATGAFSSNISVTINDTTPPSSLEFVTPTPGNNSFVDASSGNLTINISVTDNGNIQTIIVRLFNESNILIDSLNSTSSPFLATFTSFSLGTYRVNVTVNDTYGNTNYSETRTFHIYGSSFEFNGTISDPIGNFLNNSVINISIHDISQNFAVVGSLATTSNASGWFNMTVPIGGGNPPWMYTPIVMKLNDTYGNMQYMGQTLPAFDWNIMTEISGTQFFLKEAGTINITAINSTGDRISFRYNIKDQKLGYQVASNWESDVTEASINLPRDRNYSLMIFPDASMPVSLDWNNFSADQSYDLSDISSYNFTTKTLHYQFNTTMDLVRVSGYINYSSISGWDEFHVIPYLIEPGNMIHSGFGTLPYNLSEINDETDFHNSTNGFYNITLPATLAETSNLLLFATAKNGSSYYGGFRNISNLGSSGLTQFNFSSMAGLLGSGVNISQESLTGQGGVGINTTVAQKAFNLLNSTNSTMTNVFAHIEATVDYSDYGAIEFTWMTGVEQGSESVFYLPLINSTGIKEMNVFASGGDYAPVRKAYTLSQLTSANETNITLSAFNPNGIDEVIESSGIVMALYISNSTCDIPNPGSACLIGSTEEDSQNAGPMQAMIGGGKISFRMGTGNISVHYVNVDMMASGPPDALFDSETSENTDDSFESALRFGSGGPTIYDYVLVSIPYLEGSSSQTGLNESADVNMSIPLLYDDDWNVIWNSTVNGTNGTNLAGNYSHYDTYYSEWETLMGNNICTTNVTIFNSTNPCYIDTTNNKVWIRLPHFSGTGPSVSGSVITADSSTPDSGSPSGGSGDPATTPYWTSNVYLDTQEFSSLGTVNRELRAKERVIVKIKGSQHTVGVMNLTSTSALINVSSVSQQATLSLRESKKFDVENDSYYDIKVTLNSINDNKANITIESINERVIFNSMEGQNNGADLGGNDARDQNDLDNASNAEDTDKKGSPNRFWIWIALGIIAAVIIVGILFIKQRHFNLKRVGLR